MSKEYIEILRQRLLEEETKLADQEYFVSWLRSQIQVIKLADITKEAEKKNE